MLMLRLSKSPGDKLNITAKHSIKHEPNRYPSRLGTPDDLLIEIDDDIRCMTV